MHINLFILAFFIIVKDQKPLKYSSTGKTSYGILTQQNITQTKKKMKKHTGNVLLLMQEKKEGAVHVLVYALSNSKKKKKKPANNTQVVLWRRHTGGVESRKTFQ